MKKSLFNEIRDTKGSLFWLLIRRLRISIIVSKTEAIHYCGSNNSKWFKAILIHFLHPFLEQNHHSEITNWPPIKCETRETNVKLASHGLLCHGKLLKMVQNYSDSHPEAISWAKSSFQENKKAYPVNVGLVTPNLLFNTSHIPSPIHTTLNHHKSINKDIHIY